MGGIQRLQQGYESTAYQAVRGLRCIKGVDAKYVEFPMSQMSLMRSLM